MVNKTTKCVVSLFPALETEDLRQVTDDEQDADAMYSKVNKSVKQREQQIAQVEYKQAAENTEGRVRMNVRSAVCLSHCVSIKPSFLSRLG